MKKFLLAFLISIAFIASSHAQAGAGIGGLGPFQHGAGAPTGSCGLGYVYTNDSGGDFYDCNNGSWLKVTSAGGGGSVTSIATTGPITGGTITTTGTIACATCGVTGSPLSQFAATTSAQFAGVISDATGTGGAVVLAASPTLSGTPLSTTAAVDTNTTQIATTAYVIGEGYAKLASPTFSGTPSLPTGTTATTQTAGDNSTKLATTSFVATSFAPLASPTFTGTPASTTAAVDTNTTQIATTAYVIGEGYAKLAAPAFTGSTFSSTGATTLSFTETASTPALSITSTPITSGTATTNFPNVYLNCATSTGPTTFSTNGTFFGINTCTGFTGKFIDLHVNGAGSVFSIDQTGAIANSGSITGGSSVFAAAASGIGMNGRSLIRSGADGRIAFNNNANGSLGLTRVSFGTEAATNAALCPLSTILDVCDGAGTTTLGATTVLSANGNKAFVTANFTTAANTNLQTITGLTFNFPAVAHNWNYTCHLAYQQGTGNAAVAFGIQAATNTPTNIFSTGNEQITVGPPATFVTGTLATLATTTATAIVSGTPTATATNYWVDLAGTLELGATANAVNIMVSTATSADAVTILRGSSCQVY